MREAYSDKVAQRQHLDDVRVKRDGELDDIPQPHASVAQKLFVTKSSMEKSFFNSFILFSESALPRYESYTILAGRSRSVHYPCNSSCSATGFNHHPFCAYGYAFYGAG